MPSNIVSVLSVPTNTISEMLKNKRWTFCSKSPVKLKFTVTIITLCLSTCLQLIDLMGFCSEAILSILELNYLVNNVVIHPFREHAVVGVDWNIKKRYGDAAAKGFQFSIIAKPIMN